MLWAEFYKKRFMGRFYKHPPAAQRITERIMFVGRPELPRQGPRRCR
jgi:hypothetical protein